MIAPADWTVISNSGEVTVSDGPYDDVSTWQFGATPRISTYLTALVAGEGKFDVITFGPFYTPDFAPYLADMPASMRGTEAWNDILPVYRDRLMVWNGRLPGATRRRAFRC